MITSVFSPKSSILELKCSCCKEEMSKDVFFSQQHLRKWMEVVVLTHKGGQRSDGNVSDLFVSGKATLLAPATISAFN